MQARHDAIAADYEAEFDNLATTAAQWNYTQTCGAAYYAIHIELIMGYLWTVLEPDPTRQARLRDQVMGALWNVVATHDNPYFAFLNAGSRPGFDAAAATAAEHLAHFQPAPRVLAPRDPVA